MGNKMRIAMIIFFIQIIFISNTNNYLETLKIDYNMINSINSTVVISESKDLGTCTCDLTPNTCDYLCCCDTECPSTLTNTWIDDPNNICLDKKNLDNDYLTHCFNENLLYHFNRKRGMREYRDPVSNLFCVTFDNSSIMGQFYKDIQNLPKSTLNTIYKNYVDQQQASYYYFNQNTGTVVNYITYAVDDYVRVKLSNSTNLVLDGKFFIYQSGAYGECVKTNSVRFMRPNQRVSCGFRLKTLDLCENYSWEKLVSFNYSIANAPSSIPNYIPVTLKNVLIRDYETQTLTTGSNANLSATQLKLINTEDCNCSNMLEEASYSFIIENSMMIKAVYLDIILATNLKGKCKQKFIMNQSYSTKFLNSLTDNVIRSGSPGYLIGSKLWIGYNTTDSSTGTTFFEVPKEGLYMVGKKDDGTCINTSDSSGLNLIESIFDSPINYGVNTIYSCILKFASSSFEDFCNNKYWNNLKLYKFPTNIQNIGTFGNANYKFKNDWTEVIFDYDLTQSTWNSDTKTCYFPNTIILDVLTSKAGAVNNPQEYVVSARVSAKYQEVTYKSNSNEVFQFTMSFITNFVSLTESLINISRNFPSMLPGLPNDILQPLASA